MGFSASGSAALRFDARHNPAMIGGSQAPEKEGIWLGKAILDTTQVGRYVGSFVG
jgi:hypothetical protein